MDELTGPEMDGVAESSLPLLIPDYHLIRRLTRGGFGEVWIGRNHHTAVFSAVKHLFDERQEVERSAVALCEEVLRGHPHLVPILHFGKCDTSYYCVMPLADDANGRQGPLLDAERYEAMTLELYRQRHRPLPIDCVLQVATDILSGLEHLHTRGWVHCDVKPSNILRMEGKWCLGDVGLMTPRERLRSGDVRGTRWFVPPYGTLGQSADLYALGKSLFLLLTGEDIPRSPSDPDPFTAFRQKPRPPKTDAERFGKLRGVILRACGDSPKCCYSDTREMRKAISPLVAKSTIVLTVNRDFSAFTPQDLESILVAIRKLGVDIRIIDVKPGSVLILAELPGTELDRLTRAVEGGLFHDLGIVKVREVSREAVAMRRAAPRFPCGPKLHCEVTDVLDESRAEAGAWDISAGGIAVILKEHFSPGARLGVELAAGGCESPVLVWLQVEHSDICFPGYLTDLYLTGCSFVGDVPEELRALVDRARGDDEAAQRVPCDPYLVCVATDVLDESRAAAGASDISAGGIAVVLREQFPPGLIIVPIEKTVTVARPANDGGNKGGAGESRA
jgi:serine/threonine protein kinase